MGPRRRMPGTPIKATVLDDPPKFTLAQLDYLRAAFPVPTVGKLIDAGIREQANLEGQQKVLDHIQHLIEER